jgi:hypothetical protein
LRSHFFGDIFNCLHRNRLYLAGGAALRTIPPMKIFRHVQKLRPLLTDIAAALHALRNMTG